MNRTIREFAQDYALAHDEPFDSVFAKVRAWASKGHLPTFMDKERCIKVTDADPETFAPPGRGMPPAEAAPGYLTITQTAKRLGVNRARVHWLIGQGEFPGAHKDRRGRWIIPEGNVVE